MGNAPGGQDHVTEKILPGVRKCEVCLGFTLGVYMLVKGCTCEFCTLCVGGLKACTSACAQGVYTCVYVCECMCTCMWRYVAYECRCLVPCTYVGECAYGHVICMYEYAYMWVACKQTYGMHVCMWSISLWSIFMQLRGVHVECLCISICVQPGYMPSLSAPQQPSLLRRSFKRHAGPGHMVKGSCW